MLLLGILGGDIGPIVYPILLLYILGIDTVCSLLSLPLLLPPLSHIAASHSPHLPFDLPTIPTQNYHYL